ncbi:MAG TPA: helix-turn-helix domain-containing protein [Streptomyces sp.]
MTGAAPECAALAEGLRAVRSRTGLSLAALAGRTPYSKSSWERYLNGKKPVPRQAVEALCTLAGEPPARLLALWELADAEWSGRSGATPKRVEPPPPTRALTLRRYLLPIAAVLAAGTIAALSVGGSGPKHGTVSTPVLDPTPGCQGRTCDGRQPDEMFCGLPGRVDSLGPQHRTRTGASVEVRYSGVCGAAWGRIWHARVGDAVEISAPGASPRRAVVRNAADTTVYRFTPMIGEPERAGLRVCFTPGSGAGGRECFGP